MFFLPRWSRLFLQLFWRFFSLSLVLYIFTNLCLGDSLFLFILLLTHFASQILRFMNFIYSKIFVIFSSITYCHSLHSVLKLVIYVHCTNSLYYLCVIYNFQVLYLYTALWVISPIPYPKLSIFFSVFFNVNLFIEIFYLIKMFLFPFRILH